MTWSLRAAARRFCFTCARAMVSGFPPSSGSCSGSPGPVRCLRPARNPVRPRRSTGESRARSRSNSFTWPRATGPLTGTAGNHGSMSPWVVRNTFLAWGPDFKHGATVRTPASNVDLAPTLLALMNLDKGAGLDRFDGRVLREAFADGPDEEQVPIEVHTYFVESADGSYRAAIQITELEQQRY